MIAFAKRATEKATEAICALSKVHHSQGEATILRMCGPTSRLKHLFRFPLEDATIDAFRSGDATTFSEVQRILARPLTDSLTKFVSLSISAGGLGFKLLSQTDNLQECVRALASIERTFEEAEGHELPEDCVSVTRSYFDIIRALVLRRAAAGGSTLQCSTGTGPATNWQSNLIAESIRSTHASDFLYAAPGPGTTLTDNEYRDALWMRLGLAASTGHDDCIPNPQNDPLGLHRLGCRASAGARTNRHDEIFEVVAKAALSADPNSFMVAREEHLSDDVETQRRPGDVALNLGNGRTLIDLTVASPFSAACANASRLAGTPAAAAEAAHDRKTREWTALLDSNGLDAVQMVTQFVPLAGTAMGVWDCRSLRWLKLFLDACAASTGEAAGSYFYSFMMKLSVALWRANSRIIRALRNSSEFAYCEEVNPVAPIPERTRDCY